MQAKKPISLPIQNTFPAEKFAGKIVGRSQSKFKIVDSTEEAMALAKKGYLILFF